MALLSCHGSWLTVRVQRSPQTPYKRGVFHQHATELALCHPDVIHWHQWA
jgi:hypothetical protein